MRDAGVERAWDVTRERVRATQANQGPRPPRMVRVTITTVTPLTVTLPGASSAVPAVKIAGLTYTAGGAGWALVQEPAVGPVFPT